MTFLTPLYLGIVSRICGGNWKYLGLLLYPIPYLFIFEPNGYLYFLLFSWIFIWKLTGHADGFQGYERDNFLSKFVSKLRLDRESKMYDFMFWYTKGYLIAFLPAALSGNFWLLMFSAFGYPIAYYLGFNYLGLRTYDPEIFNDFLEPPRLPLPRSLYFAPTVWGETLAGVFAGLGFLFI